jgi:CRISPR-associated endonuclease/helicase Cas3
MIVTFISECEKKALKKTRRVLDAFADRIGSNAWQTVITEEGLDAVKTLLKNTATKNTAVSCHRIKSRVRTELQWIVGNKNKFNPQGNVPVNTTQTEQFIGEKEMTNIYANTQGQELAQHSFAVAVVAQEFMKKFAPQNKKLQEATFIAGCWHDIGKIEKQFQNYLQTKSNNKKVTTELPIDGVHIEKGKFSFEKYPTHNEVSLLLFKLLADTNSLDRLLQNSIQHSILWHHAKPIRKNEFKNYSTIYDYLKKENNINELSSHIISLFNSNLAQLFSDYFDKTFPLHLNPLPQDIEDALDSERLPKYKDYETKQDLSDYQRDIKKHAKNNLLRTALISADRLVSSIDSNKLHRIISQKKLEHLVTESLEHDRGLKQKIEQCLEGFEKKSPNSERNKLQAEAAEKLSDEEEIDIAVLNGPAGCGKSKIALEWAKNISAKEIIWVCPRVQICQSLFIDLSDDKYLPNAKIEIFTGEIKQTTQSQKKYDTPECEYFSGDIILTTIDQIINGITTHKQIELLTKFMNSAVVFDEFHEYINMSGFNLLFAELIECKKIQQNDELFPSTLLVSATPNHFFIDKILNIKKGVEKIPSFNNKPYTINFKYYTDEQNNETHPFYSEVCPNTFVISNTATQAQKSYIQKQNSENSKLIHSKLLSKHRAEIFTQIINSFKQQGSHKIDILRSSPLLQASVNISCQEMITEIHCAENILQRMGRLNRFGEYDSATLTICYTEGTKENKQIDNQSRFLNQQHIFKSATSWFTFLQKKINEGTTITINELYDFYEEFYTCKKHVKDIEDDLSKCFTVSIHNLQNNIFDPIRIKPKKTSIKIKKNSLRGNSRFVQMAIIEISNKENEGYKITDKYIVDDENHLTESKENIEGHDASERNLLSFMAKKHHNIIEGKSKVYKDVQLLNDARDPESPIYVSYTPDDLEKVEAKPHPFAIYYLIGKQPIGAMAIDKLNNT